MKGSRGKKLYESAGRGYKSGGRICQNSFGSTWGSAHPIYFKSKVWQNLSALHQ